MSSHSGTTYLNSCLKVPIDPCSNCPAPVFNRSKMYLGPVSVTPHISNCALNTKHCSAKDMEPKWSCNSIHSLAKLYKSIPDYRDLNHLSGDEFYSTLNTLRYTCQELKTKTNCFSSEGRCSTTTTSSSLTSCCAAQLERSKSKRIKRPKKKKKSAENRNHKKLSNLASDFKSVEKCDIVHESTDAKSYINLIPKSCKKDLDNEVDSFKKSLQEFEAEFKRPLTALSRNESRAFKRCSSKPFINKNKDDEVNPNEKVPVRSNFTPVLRERLRKSLSFNDLQFLTEPPELAELRKSNKTFELPSYQANSDKDPTKLSNYFQENPQPATQKIPKIIVDSYSSEQLSTNCVNGKNKSKYKNNKNGEYKMPFQLFNLDYSKRERSVKHSTPSPIHPVARPNLAATLRVESSKKKVNELKNNCTFHDSTAQFDWEVRKTPAWKTLSLNETHKQILQLRLATRKAEQALQQREYELNMELMRQRVKSAPLLLEGPTYWGPHVGKLSHACQKEGRRHMCQSNQQRTRRRKSSSHSHCCRHKQLLSISPALEKENYNSPTNTFKAQTGRNTSMSQKLSTLCKIYGSSSSGPKAQSRNSNHSTNTQQSLKFQRKKNSYNVQENAKKYKNEQNLETVDIGSDDELSSLDRAFL